MAVTEPLLPTIKIFAVWLVEFSCATITLPNSYTWVQSTITDFFYMGTLNSDVQYCTAFRISIMIGMYDFKW